MLLECIKIPGDGRGEAVSVETFEGRSNEASLCDFDSVTCCYFLSQFLVARSWVTSCQICSRLTRQNK